MIKTTIVAFLLLTSSLLSANTIISEIAEVESEWASIYYGQSITEQKRSYPVLLERTQSLLEKFPESVELLIWKAIIISTNAAYQSPFTALTSIHNAKKLLELAIQKNPKALDGAAFVTLGTLYYMTPGWPISFGDKDKAEQLLKKGIDLNPQSIDAHYFYADYLLSKNEINQATKYFKLALLVPNRSGQIYADKQLKKEAILALKNTERRKLDSGKNKFLSLFFTAKSN